MKAYFLKATELNQKLTDARKYGRESSTINGLVKPSCLIIDEVGRCVFDKKTRILPKRALALSPLLRTYIPFIANVSSQLKTTQT